MTGPSLHGSKPHEFMQKANCLGLDADLFFPTQGEDTRAAKAVCNRCVVRAECLAYALTPPVERYGLWGGLSERERRRLRQGRRTA